VLAYRIHSSLDFRPCRSLIDPCLEDGNLSVGEPVTLGGHSLSRLGTSDALEQQTFGSLSGEDHWARVTAFQGSVLTIQTQAAALFSRSMARQTAGVEDWFDVANKIDATWGNAFVATSFRKSEGRVRQHRQAHDASQEGQ
jgi:hypothetical protein